MAEAVGSSIAGGVSAPIFTLIVQPLLAKRELKKAVRRDVPAVKCPHGTTHECPGYKEFLPASNQVLKKESWLKLAFYKPEVEMTDVADILRTSGLWADSDARWYRGRSLQVLGPVEPNKRLAVLIGVIKSGWLQERCCQSDATSAATQVAVAPATTTADTHDAAGLDAASSATQEAAGPDSTAPASSMTCQPQPSTSVAGLHALVDDASSVNSQSNPSTHAEGSDATVDGAVEERNQARQDRLRDWRNLRDPRAAGAARVAFWSSEPDDGLAVSMPTRVFVTLDLEMLCQPRMRIFISERKIRDLARFLFEYHGDFEVYVDWAARIYTAHGEVRFLDEAGPGVEAYVQGDRWIQTLETCLLVATFQRDDLPHPLRLRAARIRNGGLHSAWQGLSPHIPLIWYVLPGLPSCVSQGEGRLFWNRNQRLPPKCHGFVKAWRCLGYHFEPADLDVGFFRLETTHHNLLGNVSRLLLYLGRATAADVERSYEKLPESTKLTYQVSFHCWQPSGSQTLCHGYKAYIRHAEECALSLFAWHIFEYCTPIYVS